MTEVMFAATICIALVAFGDFISLITRAVLPSMAVSLLVYMVLTWFGMPKNYPEISGFAVLGSVVLPLILIHLATMVAPAEFVKQWRSVVVSLFAVLGGFIFCLGAGSLLFGLPKMLAGAGAVCGGAALAGIAAVNKLTNLGLMEIMVIPLMLISLVDAFGQPIAANILRRYAFHLRNTDSYLKEAKSQNLDSLKLARDGVPFGSEENPSPRFNAWIPKKYETDGIILLKLFFLGTVSILIQGVTGVDSMLWCIVLGLLGTYTGFLRMNMLDRSNSYGICMAALIGYIFTMMNDVTPQLLLQELFPIAGLIILSALGLAVGGAVGAKIMGLHPILGAAAGVGIMFGFPGVLIVSSEVSKRIARNEEEREFIFQKAAPPMIIGAVSGFFVGLGITVAFLLNYLV